MNVFCNLIGHKYKHAEHGEVTQVQRIYGSSSNITGTWIGLRVAKRCERCGYEFYDSFRILGTEKYVT